MRGTDSSDLIQRYLAESSSIDLELALLSKQPEGKRLIFEERLRAIDRYLQKPDPSVFDVDEAAASVGVSRRQFYRLLTKMRRLGPVRGLLPSLHNVVRSSAATEGLAEPIEAVLIREMTKDPTIKIAQLESLVFARCEQLGVDRPSEWKLRRRIHALRASGLAASNIEFGGSLVVDQIALDLPVRHLGANYYVGVTLIIDRNTRLIAGASATVGDGIGLSIRQALADMSRRTVGFSASKLLVATKLERLTWVVPPGLEDYAEAVSEVSTDGRWMADVEIIGKGSRRHGELILRLLGDRLGIYGFRTRAELGTDAERAPAGNAESLDFASKVIGHCVESWNRKVLQSRRASTSTPDSLAARRLTRITKELQSYFNPVFTEIESGFTTDCS